ncbi:serine/threonine-protein phosphatase 4 regulatory subunit 4 isoform X1 [Diachasma alloeum]|uniref:serine/threonine-protein phosphatase 4 regulatory subunit 4 isoform X1 n=1 Tax=Diachasma alloeum TaxID=454923 RepID=UPI0007382E89|nr:serine/threonine-protein phosphatase 4 regulatory subunit 4 isoform X1 [Diachasma alloeum]
MWQEEGAAPFDDTNTKGDDIQKLNAIQTLPILLAEDPQTCIQKLIPKMQQTLPNASTEFHVAASSTFKTILEQKLVSPSTFTQTFLQSILNSLDTRDPVLAHAWLETLLDVIELLPTDVIRREILPVAVIKGQLSQPVGSRIMCCKIIGKICTRFDSQLLKKEVLPTVHSLCQDVNSDVRACICLQLHYVAESLGAESVTASLLPSIVELASDEESIVRHASVQTIVYLLPHLQPDVIKCTLSPLIKKSCDSALKSDDAVICIIAQEFGKLALGLEKVLTPPERTWLVKYFQQLSQLGMSSPPKQPPEKQDLPFTISSLITERYIECRKQCAYNMPAMFLFTSSSPEDTDLLLPTLTDLANDPFYMVRRNLACGLHEIARIMGAKNGALKNDFIKLVKDDNEQVLQGIVPHIGEILQLFVESQTISKDSIDLPVMEVGRALLKCEGEIFSTNNWRLSSLMFQQLEVLPKCFPSDYIYNYFVPVVVNRALKARPIPVKLAAGRAFLVFIRYNLKPIQRTELRNKLYTDLSRNSSCYVRMLYIRMMIEAMSIFSSVYFKEQFFGSLLEMAEDPIANIRLKVVGLLPSLKALLRLPSDKKLLSRFEACVRGLMNNEKDRDVIGALTGVIRRLDDIDVRHEGQPATVKFSKQDNEDMKKYEEEKALSLTVSGKSSTLPAGQTFMKKSGSQNMSSKQNSFSSDTSRSFMPGQKIRPSSSSISDNVKSSSRQTPGTSRNYELAKASPPSTSSNNLTSSWARLKSNSMILTHLWEKADYPDPPSSSDYLQEIACSCYDTTAFLYPSRFTLSTPCSLDYKGCPCTSDSSPQKQGLKTNLRMSSYFDTSVLTNPLLLTQAKDEAGEGDRQSAFFNNPKSPNLAALRALTSAAHYNSCWAFSSMPEIPVTLLDDEFLVDTGVRIPEQLSSSRSSTKISNLQDIIHRNNRIGGVSERGKVKGHFSVHEESVKRSSRSEQAYSNRLSMNFQDGYRSCKPSAEDDLKGKRYSFSRGKGKWSFDSVVERKSSEKEKRSSFNVVERERRVSQQLRGVVDKTKRHSTNYSTKPPELKDCKQKFKRHSVEVTDYHPIEKSSRKRNFTLDVNHNQGSSKIPLRTAAPSGSRTAPVTRASSPVRLTHQLSFSREPEREVYEDRVNRFNSSDEEVDKLCIRLAYVDSEYMMRENPRSKMSKLPVWVPRKNK